MTPRVKHLTPRAVRMKLSEYNNTIQRLQDRITFLQRKVDDVKRRCSHVWEKLIDPAGGPASHHCAVCGKIM